MRIGVIGTGRIGTLHANTLSRHREVGSLILTDADPARAQRLAQRLGETAAPGVDEIFRWGVDAVVITTATAAHAELIGRAARSGLPVFCEKPIALDLPGTLQALAEVAAAGTVLQMGFQRRFDAGYAGAREAVRAGRLGRLHTVRALTCDQSPPPAEWLRPSGGLFRDTLIHDFDILRWVTGREVTDVYAAGSDTGPAMFREAGDACTGAALLTLDDGTLATTTATRTNGAGYDVRMELAGERTRWWSDWTTAPRSPPPNRPAHHPRTSPGPASWNASRPRTRPSCAPSWRCCTAPAPTPATDGRPSRRCGSPRRARSRGGSGGRWR